MIKILLYKIIKKISVLYKRYDREMYNKKIYSNFEKSKGSLGIGVKFGRNVRISGIDNIRIGNNVHIGSGSFIRGEGGLEIKDNVIISRNAVIYTNSHNYDGNLLPFDHTFVNKKVLIGKNTWIGMNVTISPGTRIGEGVIIALGTRVFGEIPSLAIIGNSDLKVIKYRNKENYNKLDSKKKYAKEDGIPLNYDEE